MRMHCFTAQFEPYDGARVPPYTVGPVMRADPDQPPREGMFYVWIRGDQDLVDEFMQLNSITLDGEARRIDAVYIRPRCKSGWFQVV